MRVVVPDPALGVRRRREDLAARSQHAKCFADHRHRVGDVLEEVFHHDRVERFVGERQRLIDISEHDVAPTCRGCRHGI